MSCAINKYLDRYSEAEVEISRRLIADLQRSRSWDQVLVIPAYNEDISFLVNLKDSQQEKFSTLVIVIINQPECAVEVTDKNQELFNWIVESGVSLGTAGKLHLIDWGNSCCLIVDQFTGSRIPKKKGVGLARKIGADLAADLIHRGYISSNWIHNTDADAQLPADYFNAVKNLPEKAKVALYPFVHYSTDPLLDIKGRCYEKALNYYVKGLEFAKSPYAFHTIGSCIAFRYEAYCEVRGFPARSAGEDFYILNKMRKVGSVVTLDTQPITLQSRESDRVPFGTGPALSKLEILADDAIPEATFEYYNPQLFVRLKAVIQLINEQALEDYLSLEKWESEALEQLGISKCLAHLKKYTDNRKRYIEHAHNWFDGFRTLRWLHFIEDVHPKLPLEECLKKANKLFN